MQRPFTKQALYWLILCTTPVSAQLADTELEWISLPSSFNDTELELVPLPTQLRLSGMARVVTHIGHPANCLAAVAVNRIDGERTVVSERSFLIEPGVHTINGKARLDTTNCPITDRYLHIKGTPDLEWNFELGNTYYVGYYHKPANTDEWKLVIWNVDTNP